MSGDQPGRVPESSEVRNFRALEWLNSDGRYEELLGGAREEYARSGRGFWFASFRNAAGPVMAVAWVCADDLVAVVRAAPGGTVRSRVTTFVKGYDPDSQFVLLFENPDGASQAYRLSPRPEMTDQEKLACVREFLRTDGARLAEAAREEFGRSGRGCWTVDFEAGVPETRCLWATEAALAETGGAPAELLRMVAAYDPHRQFVLHAGHFDGSTSSYKLSSGLPGRG